MNTAPLTAPSSGYTDCLEAIRGRLAARESRLYGIAVLVVYVHQLERLFASGVCLPSGSNLAERDRARVVEIIQRAYGHGRS